MITRTKTTVSVPTEIWDKAKAEASALQMTISGYITHLMRKEQNLYTNQPITEKGGNQ